MKKILSTAIVCALLAGCGGGGGTSVTPSAQPSNPQSQTAQAKLTFKFNNKSSIAGAVRGRNYISRNTAGLGISYRPTGTSAVTFGTTEAQLRTPSWTTAISPGANANLTSCTTADPTTGAFTCTVVIAVPAGYDDFQITTWDAAPAVSGVGGNFGAGANDLSTATIGNQYVVVNGNNVFNYALSGVVNSVVLSLTTQSLVDGAALGQMDSLGNAINPSTVTLAVLAKDYDGNIIVGNDPYVDSNGTAVTVNLSKSESDNTVGSTAPAAGNVQYTSTVTGTTTTGVSNTCNTTAQTCTFLTPGTVRISYNGGDTNSALFSANVAGGLAVPAINSGITFTRSTNGLNVPAPLALNVYGPSVCAPNGAMDGGRGPDGNVYFAEPCGRIMKVQSNGTVTEIAAPGSTPNAVVTGPDNEIWIVEQGSNQIGRMKTDGTNAANFPGPLPATQMAGSLPEGITLGTDNRLWFTENTGGYIGVMNPDGTIYNQYNVGGNPYKIATGPGGYWYTDTNAKKVVQIGSSGAVLQTITNITSGKTGSNVTCTVASPCTIGAPEGIAVGPDGNMWVADFNNGILKITPGGSVTVYGIPSGDAQSITAGADGNMWFTVFGATASHDGVGRITPSGAVTIYPSTTSSVGNTLGIVSGGDGNIYFSNITDGTVTQVVL